MIFTCMKIFTLGGVDASLKVSTFSFSKSISKNSRNVEVCFVGDILLDRGVRKKLNEKGYDYPYLKVKKILNEADVTFGNLENPITNRGTAVYKRRDLIFRGDNQNAKFLKEAGFDILNLTNNHAMDYRSTGIDDTINHLKKVDIKPLGVVKPSQKIKPLMIQKKGVHLGFLGYSIFPPEGYIYSRDRADILRVDNNAFGNEIKRAKKACDFLVVSFHWGKEYEVFPSDHQKEMAHKAIDCGADLVIGHHPHVLQGVEKYKDKLIFYSLGNFIFDRQIQNGVDETVIVDLYINKNGYKEIRCIPIRIIDCQPNLAEGKDAEYILKRLQTYSDGLIDAIEIKNGFGYIY
ncbi:poly-gamma-glutamate synthesis protein (capsule biosynthesis protein) [Marinisporobacter balticus]|uniref:Poly-gamma-glutamate synthesis protein (Capsule biosynthesis protein) n=1 Tax=Marinisporobacter balticus TaxID=2018667 RepID=A0A4R2L9J4_9FIRM|nr:poly-gamma-glutamate synthesis protein (capsule biosynthesis protein) [Marinisporobacter balticus]